MISELDFTELFSVMNEEHLKNLFRNIHEVNKHLGQYTSKAAALREISVNSAIAAGHVGKESGSLSEIAKQISTLSDFLLESMAGANHATTEIGSRILSCSVMVEKRNKLLAALELMGEDSGENRAELQAITRNIGKEVADQLWICKRDLQRLAPMLARVKQVIHRTWSIVMGLRVSSGIVEENESSFFLPIASALEASAEEFVCRTEELVQLIQAIDASLKTTCECAKRISYAA